MNYDIKSRLSQKYDYEKIIAVLREALMSEEKRTCWLPQKWEYTEGNVNPLHMDRGNSAESWHDKIRIWEDGNGIAAIVHNEADESAHFEIKSGYEHLYPVMLDWAEANIAQKLSVFSLNSLDYQRQELLKRGYGLADEPTYQNVQTTAEKHDYRPFLPDGLKFVDATDIRDISTRQMAVHRGFHPEEMEVNPACIPSFRSMERSPMFRPELEIMVEGKDACIAMVVAWVDEKSNTALIEPISVWLEYQGRGIGKQLVLEALKRLKQYGVRAVYVESYGESRKTFYNKCGFTTYDEVLAYRK